MSRNNIIKTPLASLGYHFIGKEYIPKGKNEYFLRDAQIKNGINYRRLSAYEIEMLVRNGNTSDDWNNILVSDSFNAELVKNCKFYGLVRIGKLEPFCLGFSDLKAPVGLYNSTIISCDFGDNVVVENVSYLSHYIVGSEVIIMDVSELVTTNHAKFGNGIIKKDEPEDVRIWIELCNENTGRKIMPYDGMEAGDAFLWSRYRNDQVLQDRFKQLTEEKFDARRGYYGQIGDRSVIKNCKIIKDVWVGTDAYFKGANKLKNLTVNSGAEGRTQIGEGCELVNGIVGYGCRIFYGVKAVRFIMASHSQLKYGARLINSYLGNNATISCCEVLNSLIFPAHEQHHNNSFLCASLVMGQSNIAAGATIGSNHNSRGADGEIVMGRGFWPGLCVSLKHNSRFASFTMLAKGDYNHELDISLPFSLVSNDAAKDQLVVMPAYWFLYNMYALSRNAWKYLDRDKRVERIQKIEYDYLAPDTINEMFQSLDVLETSAGKAYQQHIQNSNGTHDATLVGRQLLASNNRILNDLEFTATGFENSKRKVVLKKVPAAYHVYRELIQYHGIVQLLQFIKENGFKDFETFKSALPSGSRNEWLNIGGQLIPASDVDTLKDKIRSGRIRSWDMVHDWYHAQGEKYAVQKLKHALASLNEITGISLKKMDIHQFHSLLDAAIVTKEWMTKGIYDSRAKDYANPFRKMVYESFAEMNTVLGKLEDNSFIKHQVTELQAFKKEIASIRKKFKLTTA
jgi:hypothetical protein